MIEDHKGASVEEYLDSSGTRRLNIVARDDGMFEYVEEFRSAYWEAEDGFDAAEIWDTVQSSGLFADLDAARSDAFVMAHWARQTKKIGGPDGH